MQIKRRFTTAGKSPYEKIPLPPRHVGDQESRRLRRLQARELRRPRALEPGGGRHPGPEIFPQGRRARTPQAPRGDAGPVLAVALGGRRARAGRAARARAATSARPTPARCSTASPGTWTYWGWKGGYFTSEDDARAFFDEHRYMLAMQYRRARTARSGSTPACTGPTASTARPGPLLRRSRHRRADGLDLGLRASPAARLLHPVDRGRPRRRERHHGSVGARGAPLQVRLGHRLQLLQAALREREALRRRQVLGPHELPQDRRPRGRRHQVGRHHPPRRQDGGGRHRPSRTSRPTSTGR